MLEHIFNTVLNMTITGSYIIIAVILIRLLLRKAPKIFSYCLWIIPAVRLIFPFSFSSVLSIFNFISAPTENTPAGNITSHSYVPENIGTMPVPEISTGIAAADNIINPALPAADVTASVNPMQVITAVASVVWLVGIAAMLVYFIVSYIKVKKHIEFSTKIDGNVFECEKVRSPFVLGFIKPKIYLPCGMADNNRGYVVLHEQTHIKRFDHITKIVAFIILAVHWYNPLVWIAFKLMTCDMEMSCDERVLKTLGEQQKKDYGLTLVSIGASKRFITAAPLSFGEDGVEERVVNILKFKKPKVIAATLCVALCAVAAVVCLTNATTPKDEYSYYEERIEEYILSQSNSGDGLFVPAVEIVEMTDDKTAYFFMQANYFENASYSDWLNGNFEKELHEFKTNLESNKNEKILLMHSAKINDSLVVTEVNRITEAPVDMSNEEEFKEAVWNGIADNAQKAFDSAYGGKYKLIKADFGVSNGQISANAFELVEYMGKPILVTKFSCSAPFAGSPQTSYYTVQPDFELSVNSGGEWITVPKKSNAGYDNEACAIPCGDEAGTEVLYFCDLSDFVDGITASEYKIDVEIQNPLGETVKGEIIFQTDSKAPSAEKPELKYETLGSVNKVQLTTRLRSPESGWICHGIGGNDFRNLSEKELETLTELYNKIDLTPLSSAEEVNPYYAYYVSIKDSEGQVFSFRMTHNAIVDCEGNYYANNVELYKTVLYMLDHSEPTTAAPPPNDSPAVTKPVIQKPETTKNTRPVPTTSKAAKLPTQTTPAEPHTAYVLTDVKISHISDNSEFNKLVALGLEYTDSYGGGHFFLEFTNKSDKDLYVKTKASYLTESSNYTLEMRKNGETQWAVCAPLNENNSAYNRHITQNYAVSIILPISRYLASVGNGEYRITVPFYYEDGSQAGILSVEFTLTKLTVTRAQTGEKIAAPLSVTVSPMTSGVKYVYNIFTEEEKTQIVDCCNNLVAQSGNGGSSSSLSTFNIIIIDSNNKEHVYYAYPDGTVVCNNSYYKSDKLYNLVLNAGT